jgi:hypothetical protein
MNQRDHDAGTTDILSDATFSLLVTCADNLVAGLARRPPQTAFVGAADFTGLTAFAPGASRMVRPNHDYAPGENAKGRDRVIAVPFTCSDKVRG